MSRSYVVRAEPQRELGTRTYTGAAGRTTEPIYIVIAGRAQPTCVLVPLASEIGSHASRGGPGPARHGGTGMSGYQVRFYVGRGGGIDGFLTDLVKSSLSLQGVAHLVRWVELWSILTCLLLCAPGLFHELRCIRLACMGWNWWK